jgi:hypothetical protein
VNIDNYNISFEKASPFTPIEQLLAVLPAESSHALPESIQWLMTDDSSPIIDIYKSDAPLDPNGKHLPWQFVLLLPFIDESKIAETFLRFKNRLNLEDRKKNALGKTVIFLHEDQSFAASAAGAIRYAPASESNPDVLELLSSKSHADEAKVQAVIESSSSSNSETASRAEVEFDAAQGNGMSGVLVLPPAAFFSPIGVVIRSPSDQGSHFKSIASNKVYSFGYDLPPESFHSSQLLPGVEFAPSILNEVDLLPRRPPRLNRTRFNLLDIAYGRGKKNTNYSEGYAQVQSNYSKFPMQGHPGHHYPQGESMFRSQHQYPPHQRGHEPPRAYTDRHQSPFSQGPRYMTNISARQPTGDRPFITGQQPPYPPYPMNSFDHYNTGHSAEGGYPQHMPHNGYSYQQHQQHHQQQFRRADFEYSNRGFNTQPSSGHAMNEPRPLPFIPRQLNAKGSYGAHDAPSADQGRQGLPQEYRPPPNSNSNSTRFTNSSRPSSNFSFSNQSFSSNSNSSRNIREMPVVSSMQAMRAQLQQKVSGNSSRPHMQPLEGQGPRPLQTTGFPSQPTQQAPNSNQSRDPRLRNR